MPTLHGAWNLPPSSSGGPAVPKASNLFHLPCLQNKPPVTWKSDSLEEEKKHRVSNSPHLVLWVVLPGPDGVLYYWFLVLPICPLRVHNFCGWDDNPFPHLLSSFKGKFCTCHLLSLQVEERVACSVHHLAWFHSVSFIYKFL